MTSIAPFKNSMFRIYSALIAAFICIHPVGASASNWKYDAAELKATIKTPDGEIFEMRCREPESKDLLGRVIGTKLWTLIITTSGKKDYIWSHGSADSYLTEGGRGILMLNNGEKLAIRNVNSFSKEVSLVSTNKMIHKLQTACAAIKAPIIWAHGESCPARTTLAAKQNAANLFPNKPLVSGELTFYPTSRTASRNYKLVFLPMTGNSRESWCQEKGAFAYHAPYKIYRLGINEKKIHFREFGCTIKQLCPKMKTLSYTFADESGLKSFYAMATATSNFVPLTGKEFSESSRDLALECDRLAGHPDDKLRPQNVDGILEESMDAAMAKVACSKDLADKPNLGRLHFQLGRAYLMLDEHQKAFAAFRASAQRAYPMGYLYLGHSYANGWGTKEDLRLANINWRSARELGGFEKNSRKLELAVAAVVGRDARVICHWKDKECEKRKRRPRYKSTITVKQRRKIDQIFSDIHPDLRAVYGGLLAADFGGLQLMKYEILDRATGKNTTLGLLSPLLPNLGKMMEIKTERSRFEPVIAQYALIKTNAMGTCGEPAREFVVTHSIRETWRNGYGFEVSNTTRETGKTYFKVPTRFADLIAKTDTTGEWAEYAHGLEQFLIRAGGCGSEVIQLLEKNMFAYLEWKSNQN